MAFKSEITLKTVTIMTNCHENEQNRERKRYGADKTHSVKPLYEVTSIIALMKANQQSPRSQRSRIYWYQQQRKHPASSDSQPNNLLICEIQRASLTQVLACESVYPNCPYFTILDSKGAHPAIKSKDSQKVIGSDIGEFVMSQKLVRDRLRDYFHVIDKKKQYERCFIRKNKGCKARWEGNKKRIIIA